MENTDVAPLKRLAIFLPTLQGGGAERVMVKLANGLTSRGCDVDLVWARQKVPTWPTCTSLYGSWISVHAGSYRACRHWCDI